MPTIVDYSPETPVDLAKTPTDRYDYIDPSTNQLVDLIEIKQGETFNLPQKIEQILRGYDFNGDGSTTGLDDANCQAILKDRRGNDIATFQLSLETPRYFGVTPQSFLCINLCLSADTTAAIEINSNTRECTANLVLAFFEQDCGSAVIAIPYDFRFTVVAGRGV